MGSSEGPERGIGTAAMPLNLREYEEAAQAVLPPMAFDYMASGSGDEVTLRANRAAFEGWSLVPRVLRGSGQPDLRTTVRTGSLPRWIGWLGALTAILSALGALDTVDAESLLDKVGLMALILWLVWMLAVNISLLRRQGERSESVRHRKSQPVAN